MGKEIKRKQLHYRKATFFIPLEKTLQELLEEALAKLNKVSSRFQNLDDSSDDGWRRFINTHRNTLGMQFGNLVLYAPDQIRHMIRFENEESDELDIELIAPPNMGDGKKRQFLESLLFYGVKDNHVLLLQSMSLKARDLEYYLTWVLQTAGVLANENSVFLNNFVPATTHERLEKAEVKSVKVGTPLISSTVMDIDKESVDSDSKKIRFRPFVEGLEILKPLLQNRLLNDLSWSDLQGASNLEVFVEITYKRQADADSQRVLNNISTALRHVADEDIRIELKGGGTIVGTDLQVKSYIPVDTYEGVVDPYDLFKKMHTWLMEILSQGLIDAI